MIKDVDLGILAFLQLAVILGTCRLFGWFGRKFLGQTQVVMEMVAGVALGPSLFGKFWPEFQHWLFPLKMAVAGGQQVDHPSIKVIYVMSQVGLVLLMFLVGVEFDAALMKSKAKGALAVSLSGIAAPFVLGALCAVWLHNDKTFFPPKIQFLPAMLYMGAAMCITAFPMLARIIREKGISGTSMGTLALAAGSSDDVFAWTLLAIVLSVTAGDPIHMFKALGGGVIYAIVMLVFGSKLFQWVNRQVEKAGSMSAEYFTLVLGVLMLGAWFTDWAEIYAVFGAFICGMAVPKGKLADEIQAKIEPLTVNFLLPLFFIFSGLKTRIDLLNSPYLWLVAAVVLAAAMIGKGVACTLAARACGESWREASMIGVLMNARGLMELILVNIALQAGVITQELFSVLVLMACVTTLIASPLFEWLFQRSKLAAVAGAVTA